MAINQMGELNKRYLVLDQGGHASRALLFNAQGDVCAQASVAVETQQPQTGWVEHDANTVIASLRQAMDKVLAEIDPKSDTVMAAGIAVQRASIVCWHRRTGAALSPVLSWQDRRAADWLATFNEQAQWVSEQTGLPLSPHYGVSKLQWCLQNIPVVQEALQAQQLAFGPLASWIAYQLLAEHPFCADIGTASRMLLTNLQQTDWDGQLLRVFSIPRQPLPRCVANRYPFGTLQTANQHIPLRIMMGDQAAVMYAWGQPRMDCVYINAGTGAFIQRLLPQAPESLDGLLCSVALQDGETRYYSLEATVNGAASALAWAANVLNYAELEDNLENHLIHIKDPPLFLNAVSGLGSPYWQSELDSKWIGEASTEAKAVAVLESIVFLLINNLEVMHTLVDKPQQIILTGGLANQDGFARYLADLSGIPVYRPVEVEATARGVAYLLAMPEDWPEPGVGHLFQPRQYTALQQRYLRWQQMMAEFV